MPEMRSWIIMVIVVVLLFSGGCTQTASPGKTGSQQIAQPTAVTSGTQKLARLETTLGNITIALDADMPITAGNFEMLVNKGYYNGVIFHRVISGFVIQGGDPTGTGRGGPGYTIRDEFTSHNFNIRGAVAMANSGPDTGGSQFFINLADNNGRPDFDTNYPVFGHVVGGMDIVDAIAQGETSGPPHDRPLNPVTIIRAGMI